MWGPLPRVFDRACTHFGDRTAIVDGERSLTYRDMRALANRVANGLAGLGVERGERAGLLLPNCLEFIPTLYGMWKAGAAAIQLPSRASADDFHYYLSVADASTLIYHSAFDEAITRIAARLPGLRRIIRVGDGPAPPGVLGYQEEFGSRPAEDPKVVLDEDDLAFIAFTSGSTGTPKAVRQTHATWSHYAVTAGLEIGDTRPGEVFAHVAPLTHFSQTFVMPTFMRGGTNVMVSKPGIDTLIDAIERHRVTATAVVPTLVYLLLDDPRRDTADLSSLRTVIYAGSPIAPDRLRQALDVFGPVFVQTYAGTEPGYLTCLRKEDHLAGSVRLASAGRALYHVDISIRDDDFGELPPGETGEICARQPGRMAGYLDSGRDAETLQDGWVRSGDMGYLDDEGYVFLVDRKKDMIVTGGFNVFPRQIEDVLAEHPAVARCAVIGVPDEKWGEAVKAVVVTRPEAAVTAADLIDHVKRRKGGIWAPKSVDFVPDLPANSSGKIDKRALRAPYWAGQDRNIH